MGLIKSVDTSARLPGSSKIPKEATRNYEKAKLKTGNKYDRTGTPGDLKMKTRG